MPRQPLLSLSVGAAISLGFAGLIAFLAPQFAWDIVLRDRPIAFFTIVLVSSCLVFTVWFFWAKSGFATGHAGWKSRHLLLLVFAVGVAGRLILLPGPPILEDDHYRYLWDGAVSAEGLNPYAHPPARFATAPDVERLSQALGVRPDPPPPGYAKLADNGRETLLRVNNPHIATIYPPPVQAVFALAYRLAPFSLTALKLVFLGAEILGFLFLWLALRGLGQGPFALSLYWWNPLVLKEFANSAHMDALLIPALALILWLIVGRKERLAAAAVGMAAAIKFWPAMLVAALFRRSQRFWLLALIGGAIALTLTAPQLLALDREAGLVRYGADWQRNALVFPLLQSALIWAGDAAATLARLLVIAVLACMAFLFWNGAGDGQSGRPGPWRVPIPKDPVMRAALLVLLLCLLSPTGYPWYAVWLLPFAVLRPTWLLIALPAFAGFYYSDFLVQAGVIDQRWAMIPALLSAAPALVLLILHFVSPHIVEEPVHDMAHP
ncbi:MAG: hypothetical protein AAFX04_05475 [Pseudomonadota bacterium]